MFKHSLPALIVLIIGISGTDPTAVTSAAEGLAAKYPGDRGIADDVAVLFHDDFESDDPGRKWDDVSQRGNCRGHSF